MTSTHHSRTAAPGRPGAAELPATGNLTKGPTKTAAASTPATSEPATQTAAAATVVVLWQQVPQEHDYPAAGTYLSMLAGPKMVRRLVKALRKAPVTHFKAKDILRAAGLALLPLENVHVAADLAAVKAGQPLSPCLMIGGDLAANVKAQIADGYHRVCASYYTDENTDIPVKIVKL
jgi:hypothetical protein